MNVVWKSTPEGLISRGDRERIIDAATRGLPVPYDILAAAQAAASWGAACSADYRATRWARSGKTWRERLDNDCPGWDYDPPGWVSLDEARG